MDEIIITDSSLRDGNHSVKHTISLKSIKKYCQAGKTIYFDFYNELFSIDEK